MPAYCIPCTRYIYSACLLKHTHTSQSPIETRCKILINVISIQVIEMRCDTEQQEAKKTRKKFKTKRNERTENDCNKKMKKKLAKICREIVVSFRPQLMSQVFDMWHTLDMSLILFSISKGQNEGKKFRLPLSALPNNRQHRSFGPEHVRLHRMHL